MKVYLISRKTPVIVKSSSGILVGIIELTDKFTFIKNENIAIGSHYNGAYLKLCHSLNKYIATNGFLGKSHLLINDFSLGVFYTYKQPILVGVDEPLYDYVKLIEDSNSVFKIDVVKAIIGYCKDDDIAIDYIKVLNTKYGSLYRKQIEKLVGCEFPIINLTPLSYKVDTLIKNTQYYIESQEGDYLLYSYQDGLKIPARQVLFETVNDCIAYLTNLSISND